MNYLPEFLAPALTKALGWTILHSMWQSILIAVLLSVAMLLLHRQSSRLRYRVAIGALFLNLAAAFITFSYYYQSNPANAGLQAAITPTTSYLSSQPAEVNNFSLLTVASEYFAAHLPLLVSLWLLGMALMLLRFIGGLAYLQRLKSYKTTPAPNQWQNRLHQLSQELKIKKVIWLAESALVQTPLVIGYFKPIILLPLGTISELPVAQIEAILAHELAHLKRHDYFFNLLQSLTEIIFFYHPAIWWISDYVRIERENCCDDLAVAICGDSLAYARALANLAERTPRTPGLALAFAGKDGSLLARIRRLVQQPGSHPSFTDGFVAATVLLLCLTFLSATALANLKPAPPAFLPASTIQSVPKKLVHLNFSNNIIPVQDSVPATSDLVIVKNKKGKVTEVFVDGQKVPKDKLPEYAGRIEQALENQRKGKNIALSETETLRKADAAVARLNQPPLAPVIAPPAPPIPPPVSVPDPAEPVKPVKPVKPAKPAKPALVPAAPKGAAVPAKGFFYEGDFFAFANDSMFSKLAINLNFDSTFKTLEKTLQLQEEQFRKHEIVLQNQLATINSKHNSLQLEKLTKEHAKLAAEHAKMAKEHAAGMEKLIAELKKEGLYKEGKNRQILFNNDGLYIDGQKQSYKIYQKYKKYLPEPDKKTTEQWMEYNKN
ncbi:M56 family metallopeptidase [Adhaeribacter rhizoryzae]|uniref:M56 family metallopeptidase n=1 Tax=Adhaeribacter rhizoryzae TaxID=2607907 RepID=A0A5M6D312_9BACT|nr:M56 family metallopeptidase [Adhaeribacter rhizoryzae]KAA5539555.1 M56 family metallopeptidase [Adhaeribacter rhizoryzae]